MITHTAIQDACRALLASLVVCTTGAITMAATTSGYTRATGDFLADGFAPGMELTPSGFTSNPVDTIATVTALVITTVNARSVQVSGAGRSLTVGLPSRHRLENTALEPEPLHPYAEEQYLPGPSSQDTNGPNGIVTIDPMYSPRIFVPKGLGRDAARKYTDAILSLFTMNTVLPLPTGSSSDVLRVRGDVGPFQSQLLLNAKGTHATIACTIPLRCTTTNLL